MRRVSAFMREYEIDCKLLEEIMFYRGIKHTPENVVKEPKKARGGIYRGIKHDAIEKTDEQKAKKGIYRGTPCAA